MALTTPKDRHTLEKPGILDLSLLELILAASGMLLLLVFLYLMRGILEPPIVAAAGMILLWPLRHKPAIQSILFTGGFLLLVWFFFSLGKLFIGFGVIYLLAYLFDPVVSHLKARFRVARWLSSLIVTSLFISIVALCILLLAPHLIEQIDTLSHRLSGSLQDLNEWLLASTFLDELAFAGIQKKVLIAQLTESIRNFLTLSVSSIPNSLENLLTSVSTVVRTITLVVIAPVVLFYCLKDYPTLKQGIKYLMPTIGGKQFYLSRISVIVGCYLRGQLTISAINAVVVWIGLMIADIPFALLIGLAAGILNMIPTLGAIVTNIIGITIALVFGERGLMDVALVVFVLFIQNILEQSILVPKILSHHIGLHPILILFSLFVFGHFFGIFGLLIAVPMAALIATAYLTLRKDYSIDLSNFLSSSTSSVGAYPPQGMSSDLSQEPRPRPIPSERVVQQKADAMPDTIPPVSQDVPLKNPFSQEGVTFRQVVEPKRENAGSTAKINPKSSLNIATPIKSEIET